MQSHPASKQSTLSESTSSGSSTAKKESKEEKKPSPPPKSKEEIAKIQAIIAAGKKAKEEQKEMARVKREEAEKAKKALEAKKMLTLKKFTEDEDLLNFLGNSLGTKAYEEEPVKKVGALFVNTDFFPEEKTDFSYTTIINRIKASTPYEHYLSQIMRMPPTEEEKKASSVLAFQLALTRAKKVAHTKIVSSLGAVSDDPRFYFEETAEGRQLAADFLDFFWSNKKYHFDTLAYHKAKNDTAPSCLSFVMGELTCGTKVKKICFLALSQKMAFKGAPLNNLISALDSATREYKDSKDNYQLCMLPFASDGFREHIASLAAHAFGTPCPVLRICAEASYLNAIGKVFQSFGPAFKITTVVNCGFFPFPLKALEEDYEATRELFDLNDLKKSPHKVNQLPSREFYINTWACCDFCQYFKVAALSSWHVLQNRRSYGISTDLLSPTRGPAPFRMFCTAPETKAEAEVVPRLEKPMKEGKRK